MTPILSLFALPALRNGNPISLKELGIQGRGDQKESMVMMKLNLIGALAAGMLATAAFATATPAAADARFGVYVGPTYTVPVHRSSCWHWSYRLGEWVNYCRTYSYRAAPVYRDYSYGYAPSFSFSFDSGDRYHHHHHMY
jgi:hypothetical protein